MSSYQGKDRVSFFVSSTFKDMQGERDALHRVVMPQLHEFAREYGRAVEFIDLRWGISTDNLEEEAGANRILSVCLDEIEYCSPYMIVILGERYGWMPPAGMIHEAAGQKKFAVDGDQVSVTELEIQYGIWLSEGKLDRCIFCMRDPLDESVLTEEEKGIYLSGSDADKAHMDKLKEKILGNPSAHIIRYSLDWDKEKRSVGVYDSFAEQLTSALLDILKGEWQETGIRGWIERQQTEDRLMTEELSERFSGREKLLQELLIQQKESDFRVLEGRNGCGMSSLIAKMHVSIQGEGKRVRAIYCGNGFCTDTEQLLKILCAELMGLEADPEFLKTRPDHGNADKWKEIWDELAVSYDGEKIYFLIDGINHLLSDQALISSKFLPSKGCSNKIAFVISTNQDVFVDSLAVENMKRWCAFTDIVSCDASDIRTIVTSRLKAGHKQIGESVMGAILEHPLCTNMICLELMVQDILNLDQKDFAEIAKLEETMPGNEAIEKYLCHLIQQHPKDVSELFRFWVLRTLQILAEHDRTELHCLYYMLCCMTLPLSGISMEELADMSQFIREKCQTDVVHWNNWWEEVRFVKLCRYFGSMLKKSVDDRYDFAHEQMKAAIFAVDDISKMIAGPMFYFFYLPDTSDLKQENLLPAFLTYSVLYWDNLSQDRKEKYFFEPIERAFSYAEDTETEKRQMGNQWLLRMQNGIHKNLLYNGADKRLRILCLLLKEKASMGTSVMENSIRFFTEKLSVMLLKRNSVEKSIPVCYLIALMQGYKEWEKQNPPYEYRERRQRKVELGVYHEWSFAQQQRLAWLYTELCEHYHSLRSFVKCSQDLVYVPDWDWQQIYKEAADYINLINPSNDRYLYYLCARICIMEAENYLVEDPVYGYKRLREAESFCKSMISGVGPGKNPKVFIRWYLSTIIKIADGYLTLSEILLQKYGKKDSMSWQAKHICEVAEKNLKKKQFITELPDLVPDLRISYSRTLYVSRFYSGKEKQKEVNNLWEIYNIARDWGGWLDEYATRNEILCIGVKLMEYLLMGYIPEEVVRSGESKYDYAVKLIWREGNYMVAQQQGDYSLQIIYERNLLRTLFVIEYEEKELELAMAYCQEIMENLKKEIAYWEKSEDPYVCKLNWMLQWYIDFVDAVDKTGLVKK